MDNLRKALGLPHGKHDSAGIVRRATAEIERLRSILEEAGVTFQSGPGGTTWKRESVSAPVESDDA